MLWETVEVGVGGGNRLREELPATEGTRSMREQRGWESFVIGKEQQQLAKKRSRLVGFY
jgi:hypothetical protein